MELDEVTALVYGVPKVARGLGLEDAPTDQVKADQKDVLPAALQPAGRRGPRAAAAHAGRWRSGPDKVRQLLGA